MCDHRTHGVVVHLQCSRERERVCVCVCERERARARTSARVRRDGMSFVSDYYCEVRKIRRLGACVSSVHLWNWRLRIDRESVRSSWDKMFILEQCCCLCRCKFSASQWKGGRWASLALETVKV